MALSGSLTDLNVMELLQVPASGRKTGELLIASPDSDARLYYVDGALVHLAMDQRQGQEVLVEIIGWSEGEFEFRQNVLTETSTFKTDLKRAIMLAVMARDEQSGTDSPATETEETTETSATLQEWVDSNDYLLHASVMRRDGTLVCCIDAGAEEPEGVGELRRSICALASDYPRQSLQRILLEDMHGTVAASCLRDGCALVLVADRSARIGAVSMCLDRLVRKLTGDEQK